MTEQAAFKLNRARALVRETQQWVGYSPTIANFSAYSNMSDKQAARAGKTLLAVDLCQIEGRLGTAMEQYHVVLPPRQSAARVSDASFAGIRY
jgi:hypothetical protein